MTVLNPLKLGPKLRTCGQVRSLLPRGVKAGIFSTGRLRRYPEEHFQKIISLLEQAKLAHPEISRISIAQPETIPAIDELDFSGIPESFIAGNITGKVLDLRNIRWGAEQAVREADPLTWFKNQEGLLGYAQSLFTDEALGLEQVFDKLESIIQQINFKSVSVYFPRQDGRWQRRLCTSVWVEGTGKYDGDGAIPITTIKSVIEAKGERSIVVDIKDLASFEKAGIVPDMDSIANDLKNSCGPSEMIFIRVLSSDNKLLAVVQINNRVQLDRTPPESLFLPEVGKSRTLSVLNAIFSEIAKGIENAMKQDSLSITKEAAAYSRPKSEGLVSIAGSVIRSHSLSSQAEKKKPAKPKPAILLYFYNTLKMLWLSIVSLFRAIPRNFSGYRKFFSDKAKLSKERGYKRAFYELLSIIPKTLLVLRDMLVYLLPRFHPIKPGKYAFLVHPRDMEDVYRVFPFTRYLPEILVYESLKYLPPIAVSRMQGLTFVSRGESIDGRLLAIMLTPQHMIADPKFAGRSAIGLTIFAQKMGVTFAGLGALMPSLTKYGTLPRGYGSRVGITTGHAYTSLSIANMAIVVKNLISPASDHDELIAVVGAAGSTGSASARVLVEKGMKRLLLIDLPHKREALEDFKQELLGMNPEIKPEDIILSYELSSIAQARIIVTVTNAPEAIIKEEWLRPGMIFIDDAQPPNVSEEVATKRKDIRVLKVLAHVPGLNPGFDFGLGTEPQITFTCLGEVAVLASHGRADDFTVGWPTLEQIRYIEGLAPKVGVSLPGVFYGYGGAEYTDKEIQGVAALWQSSI